MFNFGVAITGTGFMGPAHTEGLRRLGMNPVGILGSSAEKSARAAQNLAIPKGYKNFDDLLADDAVQVVHITSPNRVHFEQASRAMKAGKHVLVEKPLSMTSEESAALVQIAGETGVVAGVNYNIRYYPLNIEARERIKRGDIGTVFSIFGGYIQDWLLYPTDYNWRVLAEEGGALRAVADIGTHWMDLMQTITGQKIEAVFADLTTVYPQRQRPQGEVETFSGKVQSQQATDTIDIKTEDFGSVLLRFAGGAKATMFVSQTTAGRKNSLRYEIAGSKGALAWDGERPNEMWLGHRNEANQILFRDPGLVSEAARNFIGYPGGHSEGYDDTFKMCFKDYYTYLAAGDFSAPQPFPTFEEGHYEILLCEAILKSHQEQRWVSVEE